MVREETEAANDRQTDNPRGEQGGKTVCQTEDTDEKRARVGTHLD